MDEVEIHNHRVGEYSPRGCIHSRFEGASDLSEVQRAEISSSRDSKKAPQRHTPTRPKIESWRWHRFRKASNSLIGMSGGIGPEADAYASSILAEVEQHAFNEGQEAFLEEAFTDLILDSLEEQGYWPDYQLTYLNQRGLGLSAWGLDPISRILYLCITDFVYTTEAQTFPKTEREAAIRRLKQFFRKASNSSLVLQEHSPVRDVADLISERTSFDSIRCSILTNRVSPVHTFREPDGDIPVDIRIWDLESIRRSRTSGEVLDPIVVEFGEHSGDGLACLTSYPAHPDVKILLAFVPGKLLAEIYLEYGPRLLERNVRSFLMARGKINQGIRDSLRDEPERFLAYNNGLTATASSVTIHHDRDGVPRITKIEDLQIVNGGQTTASIAVAAKDSLVDLNSVHVQMKLAVVSPKLLDELVPNISKYANRQNAVQDSDLSANLDFLRALEQSSRSEWTPSDATGRPSKWYFERARGSYAVDKSQAGTPSDQKHFASTYPPSQRFGKNEVAIYENTWAKLPHLVCRGGQKNFAEFLLNLGPTDDLLIEEDRSKVRSIFRDLIAKAILFKAADKLVNHEVGGTYKRPVVVYTLAYLFEHLPSAPDLSLIWRTQKITPSLADAIEEVCSPLKSYLIESAGGRNITEWAKSENCWRAIRESEFLFTAPATHSMESEGSVDSSIKGSADHTLATEHATSTGKTLADCIAEHHGQPVFGAWRRYRREAWAHLGETDIPTRAGTGNIDLYHAGFTNSEGAPYTLIVAVDFQSEAITPMDDLPVDLRVRVVSWLEERRQ